MDNFLGIQKENVKGGKMASPKKWMQKVSKSIDKSGHKGIFSEAAKKAGKSTREFAEEHKHDSGKIGKRARLALVFMKSRV